ncbi:DUF2141 domain-containing protein [Sphingomonas sp. RS6]
MLTSLIAALLLAASPQPFAQPPQDATLTLDLKVKEHRGKVMIAVYDEAGWRGGKPVRVAIADATADPVAASIAGLAPGRYAIKLFQDLDSDGRMSTNPFGMPIEPFGFSRDAMGPGGQPDWADAAFDLSPAGAVQTITLR